MKTYKTNVRSIALVHYSVGKRSGNIVIILSDNILNIEKSQTDDLSRGLLRSSISILEKKGLLFILPVNKKIITENLNFEMCSEVNNKN